MAQTEMICVEISETGGPDVLKIGYRARPKPLKNEVLLRVTASGVNRPDVIQRQGLYPPPAGASDLLGLEVSGEVVEIGSDVKKIKIGDKMCALTNGGGYAEFCTVPEEQCLPIPKGVSIIEAASLPETYFTVWFNLFMQGGLKEGQTLLVHGGSSGIGTTAIQLATALGVEVYVTVGSEEKRQACLELGCKEAINYKEEDFVERIKTLSNGKGVNMILDMVGGEYIAQNIKCLAKQGRLINIAYLQGSKAEVNFMSVMMKQLTITGSTLRQQPLEIKSEIAKNLLNTVWPLFEAGKLKPVIFKVFALEDAKEAHKLMESNKHIGKIILQLP